MALNQQQKVTRQNCKIISHVGAGHQLWADFPTHRRESESECVCMRLGAVPG